MKQRTWFRGILTTHTGLHVGTGSVLSTATDAPILRGADGLPLIPGSSVKGALRAASERLLRALGRRACLVFGDSSSDDDVLRCLTTDKESRDVFVAMKNGDRFDKAWATKRFEPPSAWGDNPWQGFGEREERQLEVLKRVLCSACWTWGSVFLAGRLRVPDLRLRVDGLGRSWMGATEVRDGVGLDRDTGTAAPGIKFDLEVLPAGAEFDFELVVEPEADLAVVSLAIGELLQGSVPLGGRVTRGLGQVQLEQLEIYQVDLADPGRLVAYLTRGERTSYLGKEAEKRLDQFLAPLSEAPNAA